ncbi:unnamed protein product [Tilletia laevis]|nr:hypothetical protein CF335_g5443 [Tilletia laevis]CAD6887626.1 unnamed protein product [Tilletia caries]CAD6953068.1 unnamed protein product [Tilletia laevis]CAD6962055.1 unnamed protein product [Tilletia caries]
MIDTKATDSNAGGDDSSGDGGVALAQSASLLIGLQVTTRFLTFALNQLLVRLTDPSVFGAANVQLDLLLSTILFLARDGVRSALIRAGGSRPGTVAGSSAGALPPGLHNIALLPIPAGLLIASVATFLYTTRFAPDELIKAHHNAFLISVSLYVLGAVLELGSEPFYNRASVALNVPLRVKAEGTAVLAKGVATLGWMMAPVGTSSDKIGKGLIAFGLGQAAYGAATLAVFLLAHAQSHGWPSILAALWPVAPVRSSAKDRQATYFDAATLSLTWVLVKQSMLKHVLTESDKLAVARIGSLTDQGGYALASNYGSLVARMLFQPLEESSRIVFSTQLGNVRQKPASSDPAQSTSGITSRISQVALKSSTDLLHALLHFYALLATLLISFAPPLATPGLFLLAGTRWATSTSAPSILGSYAGIYLGVMGFNGILEGFLQATASEAELGTYSGVMIASSAAFVAALAGFSHLLSGGETALVYANSLALALRAAWSWAYVLRFVRTETTSASDGVVDKMGDHSMLTNPESTADALRPMAVLPSAPTLATFALAALYLRYDSFDSWRSSQPGLPPAQLRNVLPFLAKGATCGIACLTSIAVFEHQRIRSMMSTLRSRRK